MSEPKSTYKTFHESVCKHHLIEEGASVLAAVSGGPDSMALIHLLILLRNDIDFSIKVAHFCHGIRENDEHDARFVENQCKILNLPFFVGKGNARLVSKGNGLSLEDAARKLRYKFLFDTAEKEECSLIATGHQMEDQAETILLNLLRGSGGSGLSGMALKKGKIIRPLIGIKKEDILYFLDGEKIPYISDHTNSDSLYLRNFLRIEVMPVIQKRLPSAIKTIVRAGETLLNLSQSERALLKFSLKGLEIKSHGGLYYNLEDIKGIPCEAFYSLWRYLIESVKGDLLGIGYVHLSTLKGLTLSDKPWEIHLPNGLRAGRLGPRIGVFYARKKILFEEPIPAKGRIRKSCADMVIDAGYSKEGNIYAPPSGLVLRSRKNGDKFFTRSGSKKLKCLLIDRKLPRIIRDELAILSHPSGIFWVQGIGASELAKKREGLVPFLVGVENAK